MQSRSNRGRSQPPSRQASERGAQTAIKTSNTRRTRPPRIVLVVACSHRKRATPPENLRLGSLDGRPGERARLWRKRLTTVDAPSRPADELYAGDHWRAALSALELVTRFSSRAELWVISAGYGLIPASAHIKPYSATFASGDHDSVWRGPSDGVRRQQLENWWDVLANGTCLSDLIASKSHATLIVAAGASYLDAVRGDLASAVALDAERISVISAGSRGLPALLPATSRFRSHVGGTDAAINTRVLALLAADGTTHGFRPALMADHLERIGASLPEVRRTSGVKVADERVREEISKMRKRRSGISRSVALRDLRGRGIACEQGRFAAIWTSTAPALAR
jgi:hypothetical protein